MLDSARCEGPRQAMEPVLGFSGRADQRGLPVFDRDELKRHRIDREDTGSFYCNLCKKSPSHSQLQEHLRSNIHRRKMLNKQFEEDPLAFVPYPHSLCVVIKEGWPMCTLCNKRMDDGHINGETHNWWLNDMLSKMKFPAVETQPPLPQPPPPPEPSSFGSDMTTETDTQVRNLSSCTDCMSTERAPNTCHVVREGGALVSGDVPCRSFQGYTETTNAQSRIPMPDSCESVASKLMPLPSGKQSQEDPEIRFFDV